MTREYTLTDVEFLCSIASGRCNWGAGDIPRAQQLRDDNGWCEYKSNRYAGWWQLTIEGQKHVRKHIYD